MAMKITHPTVDSFMTFEHPWIAEFRTLRTLLHELELTEDFKWGWPCYTLNKKNIVLMHGFKDYCALLLFKGALLEDPKGLLIQQTANVQVGRQLRFVSVADILRHREDILDLVRQAMAVERSGKQAVMKTVAQFDKPQELLQRFDEQPALKRAFEALTPGRQRAYLLYFGQPKYAQTRMARIDKCTDRILAGQGLNDH
jgi:uncharacterized protein YdeI (YjbR/CyaY-like superfamily)